jgi:hypothetical protein
MGYKDIKAGKYLATAITIAFGESKEKKTPQVGIEFSFATDTGTETLWWVGYFSDKAKERSLDTLGIVGFNGDVDNIAFDKTKQVEVVVEMEEYDNKLKPKIKWVNELGGQKFANVEVTQVKATMVALNVDLKKEMASRMKTAPQAKGPAPF